MLEATADLERAPLLTGLRSGLHRLEALLREIERTFDDRGEIRDDASPALREIRRALARTRDETRHRLQEILGSLELASGQAFVTLRNERYVIPVPQGARGRVRGIVHDHSVSGATAFLEPLQVIDLNNRVIELEGEEAEERRRILRALAERVRDTDEPLRENVERMAVLDEWAARAALASDLRMVRPEEGSSLRLAAARHPILAEAERTGGARVVPLDLALEPGHRTLVITGPNMGGKTVALKTAGLLALMARSGLFVPAAEGTRIPLFAAVFADIGDEQSIDEDLSTFKSHVLRIRRALDAAAPGVLVLLDELGAATDPEEGAALGRAVLEELARRGTISIVTTHLGALKTYAATTDGAMNASMEFDPDSLRPRFRLLVGVPGLSRALDVARSLGLDEALVARAEALLPEEERRAGALLRDLEALRENAVREADAARAERRAADEARRRAEQALGSARAEAEDLRRKTTEESGELLRETRLFVEQLRAELKAERKSARAREAVSEAGRRLSERAHAGEAAAPRPEAGPRVDASRLVPGTRWWAEPLQDFVTIVEGPDGQRQVKVRRGTMLIRLAVSALHEKKEQQAPSLPRGVTLSSVVSAGYEVDVRGLMADEAEAVVDKHLDSALLAGLGEIKVIHGLGTGVLLAKVREIFSQHPRVKSFRSGESREGGAGVTIAELEV